MKVIVIKTAARAGARSSSPAIPAPQFVEPIPPPGGLARLEPCAALGIPLSKTLPRNHDGRARYLRRPALLRTSSLCKSHPVNLPWRHEQQQQQQRPACCIATMKWAPLVRNAAKALGLLIALLLALAVVHQSVLPLLSYFIPALRPVAYDLGVYGFLPTQDYVAFDLSGPRPSLTKWNSQCDGGLVLMTPNGDSVAHPGPMIVDPQGELVWRTGGFGSTANLKLQTYRGEQYLTFWAGAKAATSGKGSYKMLDSSYRVVRTVTAVGDGLFGDLHEFKITANGTALLTVYNTTTADLTGMGLGRGKNGWIVDNLFQEIDLDTGELLFQWRASDHFKPIETYMTNPLGGYRESNPFDYYHINSVDKDSHGNYLISSRHFHHVVCVSPTGETLWILGGRDNQFRDLSNGKATDFRWQHDARWMSEEDNVISLFDNQKAGALHIDAWHSRGMALQVDVENGTATLLHEYISAGGVLASSQGSVQLLPESHNVFVGWGSAAAFSEYTEDGSLLCETHLGASWFFWWEPMKSYRATKVFDWHADPVDPPQAKVEDGFLYVTWNGATEVAYWALEMAPTTASEGLEVAEVRPDARSHNTTFDPVDVIPRSGFEGSFDLSSSPSAGLGVQFRVAALDADHQVLRYSNTVSPEAAVAGSSTLLIAGHIFVFVGVLVGIRLFIKYSRSSTMTTLRNWSFPKSTPLLPPTWTPQDGLPTEWRPATRPTTTYEWLRMQWADARFRPRWRTRPSRSLVV